MRSAATITDRRHEGEWREQHSRKVEWVDHGNEDPKPFVRRKSADEIIERLGRYCAAVINTEFVNGTT